MTKQAVTEFAENILAAFHAAYGIVHQRKRTRTADFARRVEALAHRMAKYQRTAKQWQKWPVDPTTFGQFQRAGESALHCGLLFARAVHAAVEVAKVNSIGMPRERASELPAAELAKWVKATAEELESTTLDLSHWGPAALMRDADLLQRKALGELQAVLGMLPGRKSAIDSDLAHLEAFKASGLSVTAYADSVGIDRTTITKALKRARAKSVN